jgi:hypothetical protein
MNRIGKLIGNPLSGIGRIALGVCGIASVAMATACSGGGNGSSDEPGATSADADRLEATIGPKGGQLVGQTGSALQGLSLVIPAGALSADTKISVGTTTSSTALPATAVQCGTMYSIEPAGLQLAVPATLTVPFDETAVSDQDRFDDEVKVWALDGTAWGQRAQTDSSEGQVTIALEQLMDVAPGVTPPAPADIYHFKLTANPKFAGCLAQNPSDTKNPPIMAVDVVRGDQNDGMFLRGRNIKPGLQFDLFTVQNSSLLASGQPDPNFQNFGMAWYQSDIEANQDGKSYTSIRTILLDQIFGFDAATGLAPTNTFNVGFWFNNPNDAQSCGFDVTKPTPFNGEHSAGPLAMISLPDATSGLGPLCTKADTSVTPAKCDP